MGKIMFTLCSVSSADEFQVDPKTSLETALQQALLCRTVDSTCELHNGWVALYQKSLLKLQRDFDHECMVTYYFEEHGYYAPFRMRLVATNQLAQAEIDDGEVCIKDIYSAQIQEELQNFAKEHLYSAKTTLLSVIDHYLLEEPLSTLEDFQEFIFDFFNNSEFRLQVYKLVFDV